jgi:hypothetical protein
MSWAGHDHRGEYADAGHDHYDYAERHHRHYDHESEIAGLREDLGRAQERIRDPEEEVASATGRQAGFAKALPVQAARHEEVRLAGMADQPWLAIAAELAGALPALADATGGRPCPCGEGTEGDCPGAWPGCGYYEEATSEPEEYNPGPEVDGEGGMSEYRYAVLPAEEER